MEQIIDIIKLAKKETLRSERASVIKELYEIYSGDKVGRKITNWKRYCKWCRENNLTNSKENQIKFKKSKLFIKEMPIKSFCFFLSHLKTNDLHYMISVAKDKRNRGENYSAFIIGSVKHKS